MKNEFSPAEREASANPLEWGGCNFPMAVLLAPPGSVEPFRVYPYKRQL